MLRMRIIEGEPQGYHKGEVERQGYYEGYINLNKIRYCTLEYARQVIRRMWDDLSSRYTYLSVTVKRPGKSPMCYEGLKMCSWSSGPTAPDRVGCTLDQYHVDFAFDENLMAVDILC